MRSVLRYVDGSLRDRFILSYGGGVNSFALLILLVEEKRPLDEVVFADTGAELPETYRHLQIATSYLASRDIPLTVVRSGNGTLYDTCKRRRVIPSEIWRWSTRDYKITPIHAYYRSLRTHVNQYLALAYDEVERMKDPGVSYVTNLYPLIDARLRREDCVKIIEDEGLPVPVKSGCFFCPFNSISRWAEIYRNHRDLYRKAMRLEENCKHFPRQSLSPLTLRQLGRKMARNHPRRDSRLKSICGAECMT